MLIVSKTWQYSPTLVAKFPCTLAVLKLICEKRVELQSTAVAILKHYKIIKQHCVSSSLIQYSNLLLTIFSAKMNRARQVVWRYVVPDCLKTNVHVLLIYQTKIPWGDHLTDVSTPIKPKMSGCNLLYLIVKDARVYTEEKIVDDIFGFILGGMDTSANTVSLLIMELSKRPEMKQKLVKVKTCDTSYRI